jgi:hypothetical protein
MRLLTSVMLACVWLCACGSGGSCEDLAEICASCPDTPEGRQARASCEFAVDSGDELACEDRLDTGVYTDSGCDEP